MTPRGDDNNACARHKCGIAAHGVVGPSNFSFGFCSIPYRALVNPDVRFPRVHDVSAQVSSRCCQYQALPKTA